MARTTSTEKPKTVLKKALADERPLSSKAPRPKRAKPTPERAPKKGTLEEYRAKRDFSITSEPIAQKGEESGNRFCVQKHAARRLHYDLRLELDGVLKSWAITKGPSLLAGEKRLAVHTEDHPMQYLTFEGVIPAGEYGGGTMIVWDKGTWQAEGNPRDAYRRGRLTFTLEGERLRGRWHLVRTRMKPGEKKEQWLLFKSEDEHARDPRDPEIVDRFDTSISHGKTNDDLAREGRPATAEPEAPKPEKGLSRPEESAGEPQDNGCEEGKAPGLRGAGAGKALPQGAGRGELAARDQVRRLRIQARDRGHERPPSHAQRPRLDPQIRPRRQGARSPRPAIGAHRRRARGRGRKRRVELLGPCSRRSPPAPPGA
jgi:bifunctional non-homologous end joining protein LigD